jgi:hypothetical protein
MVVLIALSAAACSSDSDGSSNSDVINAINILDKAGLHDLDGQITDDKTIPANAQTVYQQLQTVTLLTEWPTSDLKTKAKEVAAIFGAAADATGGATPDQAKASEAAHNAHEGEHDFSTAVWDYLYGKAGVKAVEAADDD